MGKAGEKGMRNGKKGGKQAQGMEKEKSRMGKGEKERLRRRLKGEVREVMWQ